MNTNPILERWERVYSTRSGAALLSPAGEVLRSWEEIEKESEKLTDFIGSRRGGISLQMGNHPSVPAILLASWRASRPVCLLDGDFLGQTRDQVESQLGVTLRITSRIGELDFQVLSNTPIESCKTCLYKLTSGTTSSPRAIGFTAEQILADCDQICETMGIWTDDISYGVIAFSHSYGFSNLITPLLSRGIKLVVAQDTLPRAIEAGLRRTEATVFPGVPPIFRALLTLEELPKSLRLCVSAGAPLDPSVAREFYTRFHRKIHSFYGASECGGICYDASETLRNEAGFVGLPLRGVEIELCDPAAAEGSRILVRTAGAAFGVSEQDGIFEPSDLLVKDQAGYRIVGRESDFINVAGKKVNPALVEKALLEFSGVREAVVCGRMSASRGEEICALLTCSREIDVQELRQHCAGRLSSWQMPRYIRITDVIPQNGRGKTSRGEIAKMFTHDKELQGLEENFN